LCDLVPGRIFIGHNISYDLDWLQYTGFLPEKVYDTMVMEALINENGPFSLDHVGFKYCGYKKEKDELAQWCADHGLKGDPRKHLKEVPAPLRHKYAKGDVKLTFDVFKKQLEIIKKLKLERVHELESELSPVLMQMRRTGVRIDLSRRDETITRMHDFVDTSQAELNQLAGSEINVNASRSIQKAFDRHNLSYPFTGKGNPSFTADFLEGVTHPIGQKIVDIRKAKKSLSTFLEGMDRFLVNGRIHPLFHPTRNGRYGTATGRFSGSQPNLQQQPKRGEGKKLIRGLFIPEEGHIWGTLDYSQIEYVIFAHYARGKGAEELRQAFRGKERMDMHNWAADFVHVDRADAKTLNFLSIYNGGVHKFAETAGYPVPPPWPDRRLYTDKNEFFAALSEHKAFIRSNYEAGRLYYDYHDHIPCIKITSKAAEQAARRNGYVRTIFGRIRHLADWEASKGLNTVVQGSGGDMAKKAMVDAYKAGIFDTLPLHLTVHDELDVSIPSVGAAATPEGTEAVKDLKHIMETAIELSIPVHVDLETGPNWAEVTKQGE
jgi:DNA polymerase-1